jgi:hypothetical protein
VIPEIESRSPAAVQFTAASHKTLGLRSPGFASSMILPAISLREVGSD